MNYYVFVSMELLQRNWLGTVLANKSNFCD
jgi:hypothetical protein